MLPSAAVATLLLASPFSQAQESRTEPPRERVAALAEKLGRVLRSPVAPKQVTAFRAFLTVTPKPAPSGSQPAVPQSGKAEVEELHQVRTRVLYSDPVAPGTGTQPGTPQTGWIRYELRDEKGTQARMFDGVNFWQLDTKRQKTPLSSREDETTRVRMRREISLASQVTRLLYLDDLLRKLTGVTIEEEDHRPPGAASQPRIPVIVVKGVTDRFPLYYAPEWDGPVRVEVRLARDTLDPVAVRARPVGGSSAIVEEVRIEGFEEVQGVRLPKELRLYEVDRAENRIYRLQVELAEVRLNPPVDRATDFGWQKKG